ncbi:glycosyltransferase [Thermococcus sp. GR7]|uniref:glycosyltransferase n=1 Tax=unclassified Thermococcus TaxID=2627626 RepID=UPI00142FDF4F|nr:MULTISPECIES: glycosyltransferase [unclassified Thermococcus]NJE45907.1 glycosyltransferase [Thermococcus sp. GR7]NJE78798.1 glycosyltransferase [Thermococcus sp. GR4]NJF22102.1 glycosyltransferase [Thermococcus sp. GR5]
MRVLFISGREPSYVRNSIILKGLRENGIKVIEHTSQLHSYPKRYYDVLKKFLVRKEKDIDLIFVGFLGQPLVPIIKSLLPNKPIIFDAFISVYDTLCFDREKIKPDSFFGRSSYLLDKFSCELADIVLLDTNAHIDYFVNTFRVEKDKFKSIFVGADNSVFYPRYVEKDNRAFEIFYYATYLPLHGVKYIIEAAKKLEEHSDIHFKIVGKGLEYERMIRYAKKLNLQNVSFIEWIPYERLPVEIAKADVCLGGHFSDIDKAKRVIAGKTFQFIAMKKPTIVGDNPANRELLKDKKSALFVEHANSDDLADKILELKDSKILRKKIAYGGYRIYKEKATPKRIGKQLVSIFHKISN